mmetsp:Transcript_2933/g.10515  ORF Transcript_2933/g.10515 Transcript_2933/m.10515 type:complete len:796 (-) Transcript_2933:20-2407(-)
MPLPAANPFEEAIIEATGGGPPAAVPPAAAQSPAPRQPLRGTPSTAKKIVGSDKKAVLVASDKKVPPRTAARGVSVPPPRFETPPAKDAWATPRAAKAATERRAPCSTAAKPARRQTTALFSDTAATPRRNAASPNEGAELRKLRSDNDKLRRENESLKARLQARRKAPEPLDAKLDENASPNVGAAPDSVDDDDDADARWAPRARPPRYSCGTSRYSSEDRRSSLALCQGPVPAPALRDVPFVALAVFGAAALNGECCAAKMASTARGGFRVPPNTLAQIAAPLAEAYDAPWEALHAFACPDGVLIEHKSRAVALLEVACGPAHEHVAVLRSGDARNAGMYLVCCAVPAVERFERPAAVKRALKLFEAECSAALAAHEGEDTPLAAAEHLLEPCMPCEGGEDSVLLGWRTYAALTHCAASCAEVLRFLRHVSQLDRKADENFLRLADGASNDSEVAGSSASNSSAQAWEEAAWEDAYDDDSDASSDRAPSDRAPSLGGRAPSLGGRRRAQTAPCDALRLERLVHKAHTNADFWRLVTACDFAPLRDVDDWAVLSTLSLVPADVVCKVVLALLCEQSVVVVASDVSRAAAVALGLTVLVAPLKWQGSLISVLPATELDLLASPVPFVAGCSTLTAAMAHAYHQDSPQTLRDLCVLFVDRQYDKQFIHSETATPQTTTPPALRSDLADAVRSLERGANPLRLLLAPTSDERAAASAGRAAVRKFVTGLLDGVGLPGAWRRLGERNLETDDFDFVPEWFLAPLKDRLQLQRAVAHTQMLVSHVHWLREADVGAASSL